MIRKLHTMKFPSCWLKENPTDSTEPTQPTQTVVGAASDTELKALEVNLETLQNAVCETAWAYYLKGTQVQYDSAELTWIPKGDGGSQRVSYTELKVFRYKVL